MPKIAYDHVRRNHILRQALALAESAVQLAKATLADAESEQCATPASAHEFDLDDPSMLSGVPALREGFSP